LSLDISTSHCYHIHCLIILFISTRTLYPLFVFSPLTCNFNFDSISYEEGNTIYLRSSRLQVNAISGHNCSSFRESYGTQKRIVLSVCRDRLLKIITGLHTAATVLYSWPAQHVARGKHAVRADTEREENMLPAETLNVRKNIYPPPWYSRRRRPKTFGALMGLYCHKL
jgi:hypothetical protein